MMTTTQIKPCFCANCNLLAVVARMGQTIIGNSPEMPDIETMATTYHGTIWIHVVLIGLTDSASFQMAARNFVDAEKLGRVVRYAWTRAAKERRMDYLWAPNAARRVTATAAELG